VELKRPGVRIGSAEKEQCWRYVKELLARGLVRDGVTTVKCFLVGSEFDRQEIRERVEGDRVTIKPMHFEHVLERAKGRMLKLHHRVEEAPFLQEHRTQIENRAAALLASLTASEEPTSDSVGVSIAMFTDSPQNLPRIRRLPAVAVPLPGGNGCLSRLRRRGRRHYAWPMT
jgi:hypothetical protein